MIKFSILMPTFNRGKFIQKSVESILSQDYNNFELIIKDGGDPIFDLLPKDQRIVYIHSKDRGITHAMNVALSIASGDIFNWSNDDDFMKPGSLKFVSDTIGNYLWMYGRIEATDGWIMGEPWSLQVHLKGNIVPQPSVYWTRRAFEGVGYMDEQNDLTSDYDYWIRLGILADPLYVDRFMALYNIHDEQITRIRTKEQIDQGKKTALKYISMLDKDGV